MIVSSDWMERRVAKTLISKEAPPSYLSNQSELTNDLLIVKVTIFGPKIACFIVKLMS